MSDSRLILWKLVVIKEIVGPIVIDLSCTSCAENEKAKSFQKVYDWDEKAKNISDYDELASGKEKKSIQSFQSSALDIFPHKTIFPFGWLKIAGESGHEENDKFFS